MSKDIIIIGAGGHGKVIADIVLSAGDHVLGFLDDNMNIKSCMGIPVLGNVNDFFRFPDAAFVIAVGDNIVREKIAFHMNDVKWHTAIHPNATISPRETSLGVEL